MEDEKVLSYWHISLECVKKNKKLRFPRFQIHQCANNKFDYEVYLEFGRFDFTMSIWIQKYSPSPAEPVEHTTKKG